MASLAVLKIRIGYSSYEISRHHHPTFRISPSGTHFPFIRHRFNNQRCRIAAHQLAFQVIYTHKRNRFTHTTATYTRKRNRFTHKKSSAWLTCEPQVPHFMPPSDLFSNKFPTYHHTKSGTFGNLRGMKWTGNASFFTKYLKFNHLIINPLYISM